MKIAIVSPYDWSTPGGVNLHIDNLTRHLVDGGHDVSDHRALLTA